MTTKKLSAISDCKRLGIVASDLRELTTQDKALLLSHFPQYRSLLQDDPPIRVAFLTPSLLVGGAERWIASLCQAFDRKRFKPVGVMVSEGMVNEAVELWLPRDVAIWSVDKLREINTLADVLITWGHTDLPKRLEGVTIPVVDVQHGTTGFPIQVELAKAAVDAKANLVAVSDACLLNFPADIRPRVEVIYNGAEPASGCPRKPRSEIRREWGVPQDAKVVCYVGRFNPVKNLEAIAEAVKCLPVEWYFVCAGPPYYMPSNFSSLGKRLILPGPVNSPGDVLAGGDVFCSPSHHEAHSIALTEAWLAGIPTVTTAHASRSDLARKHGDLGIVVPLLPSGLLLAKAIQEAHQRGRRHESVSLAREVTLAEYSAPVMGHRWETYLRKILGRSHATT